MRGVERGEKREEEGKRGMENSRIVFRFDDRDAYGRPMSFVSFYERVQNRSLLVRFMRPPNRLLWF